MKNFQNKNMENLTLKAPQKPSRNLSKPNSKTSRPIIKLKTQQIENRKEKTESILKPTKDKNKCRLHQGERQTQEAFGFPSLTSKIGFKSSVGQF